MSILLFLTKISKSVFKFFNSILLLALNKGGKFMKRNTLLFFLLSLGLTLSSCMGPSSSSPGSSQDSQTSSPTSTPESQLTEEDYPSGYLGTFYSPSGTMIIDAESLILSGEVNLSLTPKEIVPYLTNNYAVIYEDADSNTYRGYISNGEGLYILQRLEGTEYITIDDFQPSIYMYNGSYTAFGDSDIYNNTLIITDTYSSTYDAFLVDSVFFSWGLTRNPMYYYAKSYFVKRNNQNVVAIDLYDYEDDYLYYSLVLRVEDNVAILDDYSYEQYEAYYSDVMLLYGEYFVDEDTTISFDYEASYDEATYTSSINNVVGFEGKTYNLALGYDTSVYYLLTEGSEEIIIRPTYNGISLTREGETIAYPYNDYSRLIGDFENENISYSFDGISLKINGQEADYQIVNDDGTIALKTTIDNEDYYFYEFKQNEALICKYDDNETYVVNYTLYQSYFVNTFVSKTLDGVKEFTIDSSFNVTMDNKTAEGYLVYDPLEEYPSVNFTIDDIEYTFSLLELSINAYTLSDNVDTSYYFTRSVFDEIINTYTSGKESLNITSSSIDYKGVSLSYEIRPYYYSYLFSYRIGIYFTYQDVDHYFEYSNEGQLIDYNVETGVSENSYIPTSDFESLLGRYVFLGVYGLEGFEMKEDGTFYVDVVNSNSTGLETIEPNYYLQKTQTNEGIQLTIAFEYDGYIIYIYKDGYSYLTFGLNYLDERLYDINGAYINSSSLSVIHLNGQDLYIDGEETTFKTITSENNLTTLTLEDDSTLVFDNVNHTVTYNEVTYTLHDIDMSKYLGDYDYNGTTYTLETVSALNGSVIGYSLSSSDYDVMTDYNFVYYNGSLALHFSSLSGDFYLIEGEDGTISLTFVSSIPIPPLPPIL